MEHAQAMIYAKNLPKCEGNTDDEATTQKTGKEIRADKRDNVQLAQWISSEIKLRSVTMPGYSYSLRWRLLHKQISEH